MLKNITLSADEYLIEKARKNAQKEKKSLNTIFREWLDRYVKQHGGDVKFNTLIKKMSYAKSGKHFTREEMNAR